ncbi:MAG: TonB family protein [Rhodothermales bacterium]|nr:TonB family protein [Rhodothermales bacterium]
MERNDYIGIGVSLALHALLFVFFGLASLGTTQQDPIGFIEVDFGQFAEGRPVQSAPEVDEQAEELEQQPEVLEEQSDPSAPEEARPVNLPDQEQLADADQIVNSDEDLISPEQQDNPKTDAQDEIRPESQPVRPLGSGAQDGGDEGDATGDDGEGNSERKTAPFDIEGLNRTPVNAPIPVYSEKVNAIIKVRITVDPTGRITTRIPLIKGNPALEQSVLETLRDWRFNPLPPNAPRENQTGIVTFRFRLE